MLNDMLTHAKPCLTMLKHDERCDKQGLTMLNHAKPYLPVPNNKTYPC